MHKALFVGIEADPTHQDAAAEFFRSALEPVEHEPDTRHWYALRFGDADFAIVDTFADEAGREAHLAGEVGTALSGSAAPLLAEPPQVHRAGILAFKIASAGGEQRTSTEETAPAA